MEVASLKLVGPPITVASPTTKTEPPWFGRLLYHALPYRRDVMLDNLRRAFGSRLPECEIRSLAKANYAHYVRFFLESIRLHFTTARRRKTWIRLENIESPLRAQEQGKGVI